MSRAHPVVLAVEREKGALREASRLLQSRYRIVTCPVESVALEFLSESRPTAVLFDAAALYLDGAPLVERWRQAAPGTRIFFVDMDGPWALLMEPVGTDGSEMSIHPCALDEIASGLDELLGRALAGITEVSDGRLAVAAV